MKFKLAARNLSIRKRFLALSSKEKVNSNKIVKDFITITHKLCNRRMSFRLKLHGLVLMQILIFRFAEINLEPDYNLNPNPDKKTTIDDFSDDECWNFFETRKEDLQRLKTALRIPEIVVFNNRQSLSGENVFLRSMYELVSGEDQYNISNNIFGRDQPTQSRAYSWFINHVFDTFRDLVTDNLNWWYENGYLHKSMEAIREKIDLPQHLKENFNICAFIDCNCLKCSRPGGGPIEDGCYYYFC
jgi:hypothetical protein